MSAKITTGQQFFHVETYGKKVNRNRAINKNKRSSQRGRPSAKKVIKDLNHAKQERFKNKVSRQRTTSNIIAEAMRKNGFCSHVESPEPPQILHGMDLPTLEITIDNLYKNAKTVVAKKDGDLAARKIREDQQILLAGVISHPRRSEDYKADPQTKEMFDLWMQDALKFLKKEYRERLQTVVLHLDEGHPHLHFYCLPEAHTFEINNHQEVLVLNGIETIHPGKAAEKQVEHEAAQLKGKNKIKLKQAAFSNAMSQFQDRLFEAVSAHHGHQRLGPARERFDTRDEYFSWLANQEAQENSKFLKRKAELDKTIKNHKIDKQIKRSEAEFESLNENINKQVKAIDSIKLKAKKFKSRKIKEINSELNSYKEERKSEIEDEIREEVIDEFFEEIKEVSAKIDSKTFVTSETKKLISMQTKAIKTLQGEVDTLQVKDRSRGQEFWQLRGELDQEKASHNELKKKYSKLEKVYKALANKFNYLYENGIEAYENAYGRLKSLIRSTLDI